MEESHKTHRPHIKVGKDEEKKKKEEVITDSITRAKLISQREEMKKSLQKLDNRVSRTHVTYVP